jgi:SOS response regulatory protein OraA/RecX
MNKTLDFEMFTKAGNNKCTKVYEKLVTKINGSKFFTEEEFNKLYEKEINTIRTRFSEFDDTEPQYHMRNRINRALQTRGYSYQINY